MIPFLARIEKEYFTLPDFHVADAGYGSEQNIENVTLELLRTALITYNMYRKVKKKKYKNNPFNTANWDYDAEKDVFTCPNGQAVTYRYDSNGQTSMVTNDNLRSMSVKIVQAVLYESNEPKQRKATTEKYFIMKKWEAQKKTMGEQLSDEEMGKLYGKHKIDVEPFFGFLKANLGCTRFSVRGKTKVENELGFALMAVNLRKYTASSRFFMYLLINNFKKDGFHIETRCEIHLFIIWLVMSQSLLNFLYSSLKNSRKVKLMFYQLDYRALIYYNTISSVFS